MSKLSAASRLRDQVLAVPGTVLLYSNGHVDQVIRFNILPEVIENFRKQKAADKNYPTAYTGFNLDNGPESEVWTAAIREAHLMARRDRPIPHPLGVAPDCHTDWNVGPEDVPVIEFVKNSKKVEA